MRNYCTNKKSENINISAISYSPICRRYKHLATRPKSVTHLGLSNSMVIAEFFEVSLCGGKSHKLLQSFIVVFQRTSKKESQSNSVSKEPSV